MKNIRVIVADDHTMIRSGLKSLIDRAADLEVIAEAQDGMQAVQQAQELHPDVVVLDIAMPNLNGIEAARQITSRQERVGIVILSMHSDEGYVLKALKAGARGYILKDSSENDVISAVRAVSAGKAYFSPEISRMMADDYLRQMQQRGVEDSYELLTTRERQILQMLAEGKSNKEVASALDLSLHTVETHRSNILQKLNLHSIPELILYAVRKGIVA